MPIVFRSDGAPTCCGEVITHNGYCILCGQEYDIKEVQDKIVRMKETKEFLEALAGLGSNAKLSGGESEA